MNHPYPCWASQDEARHAAAAGDQEDEDDFWNDLASTNLRRQMELHPGDTWFTEAVRTGKKGLFSPQEMLDEALEAEDAAITQAYSDLMRSEQAKELRELLTQYWDDQYGAANAALLYRTQGSR